MTETFLEVLCKDGPMAGWFSDLDGCVFAEIMSRQPKGDVLEIGTYVGDSAIPMGDFVKPDEKFVVCDLWEDVLTTDEIDYKDRMHYAGLTLETFLKNWDDYHKHWRPEIRQCDSLNLDLGDREFRFSHIDGCHMYEYVIRDIRLAADHCAEFGVLVMDDYRRQHVPGVAAAVWHAEHEGVIHPFATTPDKLYAATNPDAARHWLDVLAGSAMQLEWDADTYTFPTYEVLMVRG